MVPTHDADGTVISDELDYDLADLEGLLATETQARKDKARNDVGEDAVTGK